MTLSKNEIPAQIFLCEFCETSNNTFFKEPFGRLLHHKHSFCVGIIHNDIHENCSIFKTPPPLCIYIQNFSTPLALDSNFARAKLEPNFAQLENVNKPWNNNCTKHVNERNWSKYKTRTSHSNWPCVLLFNLAYKQCNRLIKGWLHCLTSESKGRFFVNNILIFDSAWCLVMAQIQFSLIKKI